MSPQEIKEYIVVNEKLDIVLEELGCHHIKPHDNYRYYTAGFPDGDNKKGFTIFTDGLNVESYTRNIKDQYGNSDIISLICFIKQIYFTHSLKWLCEVLGIDYYSDENNEVPLSLQWTNLLFEINENVDGIEEDTKLKPINENILDTYYKCGNELFLNDGISYSTQKEFEIGLDLDSERITIPIRDELGTLVGVKGRKFYKCNNVNNDKYIYLERCPKSRVLYGLYKTIDYIKECGICIVVESEKSVLTLWDMGIKNSVSIGGHSLSRYQVEKITRLGVSEVVICYDSDVNRNSNGKINKNEYIEEANKFIPQIKVSAMVDIEGSILKEKESPVDNIDKFNILYEGRRVLQGE